MPISSRENGELYIPYSFKYCANIIHEELGHKDIQTYMNRYVFNTEKMQNDAMIILAEAIS